MGAPLPLLSSSESVSLTIFRLIMCDIPVRYFIRAGGREEEQEDFRREVFLLLPLNLTRFTIFYRRGEKKNLFLDNLIR